AIGKPGGAAKAGCSGSQRGGPDWEKPPAKAATSRSSRLAQEATAVPTALPALATFRRATASPAAAAAARATPSATTPGPGRQPSSRAWRTVLGPEAIASRQPRPPQAQDGPSGSATPWPTWPALPL